MLRAVGGDPSVMGILEMLEEAFGDFYGTEPEEIVACLQELAASRGGRVENVSVMPAVFVSKDRPFLKVFSEAYDRHWGIPYSGSIAMGGSYAKTMPDIVSWGPIFPG